MMMNWMPKLRNLAGKRESRNGWNNDHKSLLDFLPRISRLVELSREISREEDFLSLCSLKFPRCKILPLNSLCQKIFCRPWNTLSPIVCLYLLCRSPAQSRKPTHWQQHPSESRRLTKEKKPLINLSWTKSNACGLMKLRVPLDVHNIYYTQAVWAVCLCTDEVSHTCPLTGLNQFSRTYCATTWKTFGRHTSQGSGPGGPSTFAEPQNMNSGDGNDGKTWTTQETAPSILIIIELYWIVGARAVGR